jgi:DNA-binding beta-propeller fold protein YncE
MAISVFFSGCGAAAVAPPAENTVAASRVHGASSSTTLIWTIDGYVYAYTLSGQESEVLSGFSAPVGLCSDPSGDIYVVDKGRQLVYVYAPGQTLPFYIYDDLGESPSSCAFDPTTGNLAVTNAANVTVFPPDSGEPLVYKTAGMDAYAFLSYDKSGNLYVDGSTHGNGTRGLALAELPAGGKSLTSISISNLSKGMHRAGGLVWDGQDIAVADSYNKVIYRIAVSGYTGEVVNTWRIWKWHHRYNPVFAIDGKQLYFPDKGLVEFFPYPPKGRPRNGFSGHIGNTLVLTPEVLN